MQSNIHTQPPDLSSIIVTRSGRNVRVTLDFNTKNERWLDFNVPQMRVVRSRGDFSPADEAWAREVARLER